MRNPVEGSALAACTTADCPVINAGDGGHLHPTQTLTDLVTLNQELGKLDDITVGLCGDLKFGRTVHSLVKALCNYKNVHFVLIATKGLELPQNFKDIITKSSCTYSECSSLEDGIKALDVLYMTRIQKERFLNGEEFNAFVLDNHIMSMAKEKMLVLHPLPRVDEIAYEVDDDSRAAYFRQARYGVFARMALILTLLNEKTEDNIIKGEVTCKKCSNPKCVTNIEKNIECRVLDGVCEFCEHTVI
ncbi:MAG: aspartate carbamoyltransferase, partial [Oscillospiraceae bacterium]